MTVEGRFEGPPGAGNGGYSCGIFAAPVEGAAHQVTLRRPVPLDQPLMTVPADRSRATIADGDGVIAEVEAIDSLEGLEPPVRPSPADAAGCAEGSPFLTPQHPFPGCFVCGHAHPDGLGIYAGPVGGDRGVCAARLEPSSSIPAEDGCLRPEIVWAALDCPSYTAGLFDSGIPHLLGTLSGELIAPVGVGEPSVVVGWELGSEGRKVHSASAVLSAEGDLLARARAIWIAMRVQEAG